MSPPRFLSVYLFYVHIRVCMHVHFCARKCAHPCVYARIYKNTNSVLNITAKSEDLRGCGDGTGGLPSLSTFLHLCVLANPSISTALALRSTGDRILQCGITVSVQLSYVTFVVNGPREKSGVLLPKL